MFISFEGKDGSGKSSHAEALSQRLIEEGYKVQLVHFPRYESAIGSVIGEMLNGDRMMPESFKAFQMLYIADQLDFQQELNQYLEEGYIVIADRYDLSTVAYYASKIAMYTKMVYQILSDYQKDLLKPDITFIFNSDFKDLNERRKDMDKSCDEIEKDNTIMNNINDSYLTLWDMFKHNINSRKVELIHACNDIEENKKIINDTVMRMIKG